MLPCNNPFLNVHARTHTYTLALVFLHVQGMDFTTDKLRSLVRKWQTLIEAYVDVRTTDGFMLRLFCIAFTKKRQGQIKRTAYAQSSQIRAIRKKMVDIMYREASGVDLKDLVSKFIPEAIGKDIEKACQGQCCCVGLPAAWSMAGPGP